MLIKQAGGTLDFAIEGALPRDHLETDELNKRVKIQDRIYGRQAQQAANVGREKKHLPGL